MSHNKFNDSKSQTRMLCGDATCRVTRQLERSRFSLLSTSSSAVFAAPPSRITTAFVAAFSVATPPCITQINDDNFKWVIGIWLHHFGLTFPLVLFWFWSMKPYGYYNSTIFPASAGRPSYIHLLTIKKYENDSWHKTGALQCTPCSIKTGPLQSCRPTMKNTNCMKIH